MKILAIQKGHLSAAPLILSDHLDMSWLKNVYLANKEAVGNGLTILGYKPDISLYRFAAECSYI